MGAYLSEPITRKDEESGTLNRLAFGAVSMQGWRKSMEDSHVCQELLPGTSLFAVFDGHCGKEVAKFCKRHFAEELKNNKQFRSGRVGPALKQTFLHMDRRLEDRRSRAELEELRQDAPPANPPPPVSSNRPSGGSRVGPAVLNGLTNGVAAVPMPVPVPAAAAGAVPGAGAVPAAAAGAVPGAVPVPAAGAAAGASPAPAAGDVAMSEPEAVPAPPAPAAAAPAAAAAAPAAAAPAAAAAAAAASPMSAAMAAAVAAVGAAAGGEGGAGGPSNELKAKSDEEMLLAYLRVMALARSQQRPSEPQPAVVNGVVQQVARTPAQISMGPSRSGPVCHLQNHEVVAGCTAVAVVVTPSHIVTANAGDSRAVLCRRGEVVELSHDHKPLQAEERERIEAAGGFVRMVEGHARVNGNLNLSRSIGDLKYKQNRELPQEEQIITALPDVVTQMRCPDDEFLVVACDGIWDCMSNEDVVAFVRARIGNLPPATIVAELFDQIISPNPRNTRGIGGDNMTCVVVDLSKH